MTVKAYITPEVLSWARETAGYTTDEIASKLKNVSLETIEAWEDGTEQPSYAQLETLAGIYRRPVVIFYLPAPPDEESVSEKCRSLPEHYAVELPPEMRFLIRKAMVRQMNLRELYGSVLPSDISLFKNNIPVNLINDAKRLAQHVRGVIDISWEEQISWKGNIDMALKKWRAAIEKIGVWVFKDAFKQDGCSGFCLNDDYFPVIYVNNSTDKPYQIFTMFHELGRIIKGNGGISFRKNIENELYGKYKAEEIFCNRFAAEFLLPSDSCIIDKNFNDMRIQELALKYSVSRHVILRKYLDRGIIDSHSYNKKVEEWDSRRDKRSKRRGYRRGNYYATQGVYAGQKYLRLVFSEYYKQRIDEQQVADYLGVKITSVPGMESVMLEGEVLDAHP